MSIAAVFGGMWQTWLMRRCAYAAFYLCLTARATVTLPVATTSVGKFGRSPELKAERIAPATTPRY